MPPIDDGHRPSLHRLGRLAGAACLAGVLVAALALPAVGGAAVSARNAANSFMDLPGELQIPPLPQRSRILAADGSQIATFFYQNRESVPLAQVNPIMRKAVVAIEDSRFYEHGGIDPKGTLRALITNTQSGGVVQGGSTLTQQYVKNVLIESAQTPQEQQAARAPTLARKLRELRYALTLEKKYTKDQILERYLNISYFGDGAYGVEAAARHYFGTSAAKLTLPQAATLAGIVRSPGAYDPRLNPTAALDRRNTVLARMAQVGAITQQEADEAMKAPLGLRIRWTPNGCAASDAPFFCDYVINEIKSNPVFGKTPQDRVNLLLRGGLTIRTTLDWKVQKAAQRAVDKWVPPDNASRKAAAEALVEPGTGKILGIAIDRDFGPDTNKRGVTSVNFAADQDHGGSRGFQAGSTFKVFTLAAALDSGLGFGTGFDSPARMTLDGFTDCKGNTLGTWNVGNAGDSEAGKFDMRDGTAFSVNTYFAQLERKIGVCATARMAKRLGIHRADGKPLQVVPSFTLGSNEVSPLTVATAYATLAARGTYCQPIAITEVTDAQGAKLGIPDAQCHQVLDPQVADAVTYLLQGVLSKGTAAGLDIGRPAAAKTGTTDDYWYAWFAGYTPQLASAVWVGDPRGGQTYPLRDITIGNSYHSEVFGATIPGPIWQETMRAALAGAPVRDFTRPPGRFFTKNPFDKPNPDQQGRDGTVPDVRGQQAMDAWNAIADAGFRPRFAVPPISSTYPRGTVANTDPAPNSQLAKGETVTIYISRGDNSGQGGGNPLGGDQQGIVPPIPVPSPG